MPTPALIVVDVSGGLHHSVSASIPCDVVLLDRDDEGGAPENRAEIAGEDCYFTRFDVRDDQSGLDPDYCDRVDLATAAPGQPSLSQRDADLSAQFKQLVAERDWTDESLGLMARLFLSEHLQLFEAWLSRLREVADSEEGRA